MFPMDSSEILPVTHLTIRAAPWSEGSCSVAVAMSGWEHLPAGAIRASVLLTTFEQSECTRNYSTCYASITAFASLCLTIKDCAT